MPASNGKLLTKFAQLAVFAALVAFPVSCTKTSGAGTGGGGNGDAGNSLLFVRLQSQYDGNNTRPVTRQTCSVPTGSPSGTTISCTLSIPQQQLFYSSLLVTLSTDSAQSCDQLVFRPYYYQGSRTANYKPEWAANATDCSGASPPASCFNGPATTLITDFPTHRALFTPTSSAITASYTIASAFSQGRHTNRWAANDLPAASRNKDLSGGLATPVAISDDYLASSMQDYSFACRDTYGKDLYTINLTVTPTIADSPGASDVNDPTINLYPSWLGTLAPQPRAGNQNQAFPFQVVVQTQYDNQDELVTQKTCSIPVNSALGTVMGCSVAIPEAQLHFSKLILTETADVSAGCAILNLQPYYYRASTSATFSPTWTGGQTVDCTQNPTPIDCFSGIALFVVPSFPIFDNLYQLTKDALSLTITAPSAESQKRFASNRMTCNTLAANKRGTNLTGSGDGYIANSMRDYKFTCRDEYYQPLYTVNLTIDDINVGAFDGPDNADDPTKNQFPSWNSALDPQ